MGNLKLAFAFFWSLISYNSSLKKWKPKTYSKKFAK